MKQVLLLVLALCSATSWADVKISQLPLGSGASVLNADSFPYVDTASGLTKRLQISDIPNVPSFVVSVASTLKRTVNSVSTTFTVPTLTKDYVLNADTTSGPFTVTLPSSTPSNGWCIDIKVIGASALAVNPPGGQTVDGQPTDSIDFHLDSKHYCAVSGNWFIY